MQARCPLGSRPSVDGAECVWHDARFAIAGHAECTPARWWYEWNDNYINDQPAAAPHHPSPFLVGKLDGRGLSLEPRTLVNPRFSEELTGWRLDTSGAGSASVVMDATRNNRVAALTHNRGWSGSQLTQVIARPVEAGEPVCATTLAKGARGQVRMELVIEDARPPHVEYASLGIPATDLWVLASVCGEAPAGAIVQVGLRNRTVGNTAYFDNVGTNPRYSHWEGFPAVCAKGVRDTCIDAIYAFEQYHIRQRLSQPQNRSAYWIVGNEPDFVPRVSGRQYARQFVKYRRLIKSLDPHARIVNGGLARPEEAIDSGWLDEFASDLSTSFDWPDIWNIHLYPQKGIDDGTANLRTLRRFRRYLAETDQSDKPVWITEFGVLEREATQADVTDFLNNMVLHLSAGGLAQRWFWFVGHCEESWCTKHFTPFTGLCTGNNPTVTGDTYIDRAATTNLVRNGSFEEGSDSLLTEWKVFGSGRGTATRDFGDAFDDWWAARLQQARGAEDIAIAQELAVTGGQRYAVNAWVRSSPDASAVLAVQVPDGNGIREIGRDARIVDGRWTHLRFDVRMPENVRSANVVCRNNTGGTTVWCDAITVTPLSSR